MKVSHRVLASMMGVLAAWPLAAQTPVLSGIEAPYPALQSPVRIAGGTYGPGAVPYGPAGTPLVLSGADLGTSGTVEFFPSINGSLGTPVQATATMWNSTMIFVTVPSGAASGLVKVTAGSKTSNGLPFVVMPGVYAGSCPASPSNSQLQITTGSLNDGTAGQAYSATLNATGGTTPYTWSITGGSLPGGLSLNASPGTISGTPTGASGPVYLTVQVTDSSSPHQTNEAVLSLTIDSQTLTAAAIYTYSASYDNAGNVLGYSDSTYNGGSIMGTWSFQYDTLNHLVSGSATAGSYSGQNACWTYDSFGNRTSEALSPTACNNDPPLLSWATYNVSNTNRMDTDSASNLYGQTPGYDAAGDLTSDGGNTYLYDAEGRICAVQSTPVAGYTTMTGYLYDADGNRVAKGTITTMSCDPGSDGFQLTESYVLGQGGEELAQLDGNNDWQRTNVYGAGQQLATYDTNGLHFQLTDPLGTRRMQTSDVGQPETDIQSLPFGDQLNIYPDPDAPATADDATPLHFTGKERDAESGNDYFGARYYASSMGRWLSPDESLDGAIMELPQTWNKYSYEYNRPLYGTDPDGRCPPCIGAIIGGVVEGGFDLGKQFVNNGYSFKGTNWREVGANVAGGAVAGAIAGATGGASLILDAAAGATGNIAGGIVTRAVSGDSADDVLSAGAVSEDTLTGFVGGGAGHVAAEFVHIPDEPTFNMSGRNGRFYNQAYRQGLRDLNARNTRAFVNQGVRAGISSSATTHTTNSLYDWFSQWWFNQPPPPPPPPNPPSNMTIIGCTDMQGNPCQ